MSKRASREVPRVCLSARVLRGAWDCANARTALRLCPHPRAHVNGPALMPSPVRARERPCAYALTRARALTAPVHMPSPVRACANGPCSHALARARMHSFCRPRHSRRRGPRRERRAAELVPAPAGVASEPARSAQATRGNRGRTAMNKGLRYERGGKGLVREAFGRVTSNRVSNNG